MNWYVQSLFTMSMGFISQATCSDPQPFDLKAFEKQYATKISYPSEYAKKTRPLRVQFLREKALEEEKRKGPFVYEPMFEENMSPEEIAQENYIRERAKLREELERTQNAHTFFNLSAKRSKIASIQEKIESLDSRYTAATETETKRQEQFDQAMARLREETRQQPTTIPTPSPTHQEVRPAAPAQPFAPVIQPPDTEAVQRDRKEAQEHLSNAMQRLREEQERTEREQLEHEQRLQDERAKAMRSSEARDRYAIIIDLTHALANNKTEEALAILNDNSKADPNGIINGRGDRLIKLAIELGNKDFTQALINKGVSLDMPIAARSDKTPYQFSTEMLKKQAPYETPEQYRNRISQLNKIQGLIVDSWINKTKDVSPRDAIKLYAKYGLRPDAADSRGQLILTTAIKRNDPALVQYLVTSGAPLTAVSGNTPAKVAHEVEEKIASSTESDAKKEDDLKSIEVIKKLVTPETPTVLLPIQHNNRLEGHQRTPHNNIAVLSRISASVRTWLNRFW